VTEEQSAAVTLIIFSSGLRLISKRNETYPNIYSDNFPFLQSYL